MSSILSSEPPSEKGSAYRVCVRLWRLTNNQHSTTTPHGFEFAATWCNAGYDEKQKHKEIRRFHYLYVAPRTNLCWNLTCEVFDLLHSPRPHTLCPISVESQTNFSCWWVLISKYSMYDIIYFPIHLDNFYGKCRKIYHTLSVWVCFRLNTPLHRFFLPEVHCICAESLGQMKGDLQCAQERWTVSMHCAW